MTDTKAVNLTEDEIQELLRYNGMKLYKTNDMAVERINYLNKRLKAFKEIETKPDPQSVAYAKAPAWPGSN